MFYSFTLLLQISFIVHNFSINMIITYGAFLLVFTNALMLMAFSIAMEDAVMKIIDEANSSFWSTDSVGPEVQHIIRNKSAKTNHLLLSIYAVLLLSSIVMFPIFGDHREWSVCEVAFDHYLGAWSKFFTQLLSWSCPVMFYVSLRPTGGILYVIEGISLQIFLINQRILQVSDDHPDYDKLKVGQKILWQNKIFHTLLSCIKHHVIIVKVFKKLLGIVKLTITMVIIIGVLGCIALVSFVMLVFENASTIMKLRLGVLSTAAIIVIVLYCQAGQKISDQMEGIFDTLTQCSWYNWDAKNKQILLIFVKNSLKSCSLGFAGYVADYQLAVSIMRTSFSYGVVLYNLGSLSDNSNSH
ncbi:hypothetical protein MTP99_003447 [Tenebrio molitor]|nr:hypothetical protein MTP99_003447 [Tenebrio molitor]